VGLDPHEGLAEVDEARDMEDSVGVEVRVHKTAVNRSVTAVTGLTEPAQLLKPTGNCPPNRAYETELFG
jgi:hypothetical protein